MSNTLQQITNTEQVRTTVTLDLGDCDEAYRGALFEVWVTPTRAHWRKWYEYVYWLETVPQQRRAERDKIEDAAERTEFDRVMSEQLNQEMYTQLDAWFAETWDNLDLDEVTQIREHLQKTFPAAWQWLRDHTLRTMREYSENLSKN